MSDINHDRLGRWAIFAGALVLLTSVTQGIAALIAIAKDEGRLRSDDALLRFAEERRRIRASTRVGG